jgi:hypothetical protein
MEIKYLQSEYVKVEEKFTCTVIIDKKEIMMIGYVYNNQLSETETAPVFYHSEIFNNFDEKTQEDIIKAVNKKINEYLI